MFSLKHKCLILSVDLLKNNDVKKQVAKNSKKVTVQKAKKLTGKPVVSMIQPVMEQLVKESQLISDGPALPTLPSEWIDIAEENSVEVTSSSIPITTQSGFMSTRVPSVHVAPESSQSWLFANKSPSSRCASLQPAIMIGT